MLDVSTCVRLPRHASWGEILDFKHPASFGGKLHGHPDLDKKNNNQAKSFFRLNFNLYINAVNRERARERNKNHGDQFLWTKNMKIL